MAEIERRTRSYGLPAMRWPDPWPADYLFAMRATTFAFAIGSGREFALTAFRRAFQHGVDLSIPAHVLQCAREAELNSAEVHEATRDPEIKQALLHATEAAYDFGVFGVPTIAIGDELFWGDDRLADAAAHLTSLKAA
jgi:2-hydroxychromene-2-carboxylate isomerase